MKRVLLISICILLIMLPIMSYANINTSLYKPSTGTPTQVSKIGKPIVGAFKLIGTIVAIGTLLILAMRLALSSPSEKADIKGRMTPYIIGAVMLFTITHLLDMIYDIMN